MRGDGGYTGDIYGNNLQKQFEWPTCATHQKELGMSIRGVRNSVSVDFRAFLSSVSVGKRHGNTGILSQRVESRVAIFQELFKNFGTQTSEYLTFFRILSSELLRNHSFLPPKLPKNWYF